MWRPPQHDPIIAPKFKKKKRGYYNLKRRQRKGQQELVDPMKLYQDVEGQLSVPVVAAITISRRHTSKRCL